MDRRLRAVFLLFLTFSLLLLPSQGFSLKKLIPKIPNEDVHGFILFHVYRGYILENPLPQYVSEYNADFSSRIYNYFVNHCQIHNDTVKSLSEHIICFPNGMCIDIDDSGVHPVIQPIVEN